MTEFNTPGGGCRFAMSAPGLIVEIGGGYGENTKKFLTIAKEHDRRVMVIDPFEGGWGEMPAPYRYAFSKFESNVEELKDYLILHKQTSLSLTSYQACQVPVCFAYVDGLQWRGAVISDLLTVSHAFMICVDDNARPEVASAIEFFINLTGRKLITKDRYSFIL